jgi:mono/diheme cytochrome c family protein
MSLRSRTLAVLVAVALLLALPVALARAEAPKGTASKDVSADPVKRGEYLVQVVGCGHCHTPGALYGEPDPTRLLSGSEVGWKGRWGVTYPKNLTPDPETGLGKWTAEDIANVIRSLRRPDGTVLHLPMPWFHFIYFTDEDARAIAAYLKSIPPVKHKVPDFVQPGEKAKGAFIEFPPPPEWDKPRYR